jgi:3-hydroxymyristoyl/3-hydroxydecanoyl-(acyl carrier protein) dehydratase
MSPERPGGARTVHVPADHPAFDGHFPEHALLPGVMLLAEVIEALVDAGVAPVGLAGGAEVSAVKFLAPVEPGAQLDIRWSVEAPARARFEVWRQAAGETAAEAVLAASGRIAFTAGAAEAA